LLLPTGQNPTTCHHHHHHHHGHGHGHCLLAHLLSLYSKIPHVLLSFTSHHLLHPSSP
jgi:hypothetical protein